MADSGRLIRDVPDWVFTGAGPLAPWVPPHRLRVWEFGSGELLAMVTERVNHATQSPAGVAARIREDHPGRDVEIVAYLPGTGGWFCEYRRLAAEPPRWITIGVAEYAELARRIGPPFEIDDEEDPRPFAG